MEGHSHDRAALAVVIPAYKSRYFRQTLESLASQTDSRFNVYVGDDCSPEDLGSIVEEYSSRMNLVYRRFPENLGGRDLVSHWQRCLDMVGEEEFVCIFSDDDIMLPDAVSSFYRCADSEDGSGYDVYHFNISFIGGDGKVLSVPPEYGKVISCRSFFRSLYDTHTIDARMPEFIFRTSRIRECGFVRFDLAYRTDNATVMMAAGDRGICSIPGVHVQWRDSGINVSSSPAQDTVRRRVMASIDFFNWTERYFSGDTPVRFKRRIKMYLNELLLLSPFESYGEIEDRLRSLDYFRGNSFHMLAGKYWLRKMYRRRARGVQRP